MAAGTITQVWNELGTVKKVVFTCTASVDAATFPATVLTTKIDGRLLAIETNPGTTAPTDNYNITLLDADGHDVLEGVGLLRDTATTEKAAIIYSGTTLHSYVDATDTLTLTIADNAINSAGIVVSLYYTEGV